MTSHAPFSAYWPRFVALLSERTGLQIRDKDRAIVLGALEARCKALGVAQAERYLELLESDTQNSEWKNLLPLLTNGESYFLRDSRQFSLLRETLLPELLAARTKERQLRLWSAGCSTGEEAYSLAMLVDELAPRNKGWNVLVLGTDLNESALAKARIGIYNQWSFRGVSDEIKARYFQKQGPSWKVGERLRSFVEFRSLNLRSSQYPDTSSGLSEMDIILCRNVLIYLRADAVAHALAGFTATLREGGFLLTGHAELAHHTMSLKARLFPESVAYQKLAFDSAASHRPTAQQGITSTLSLPVSTTPLQTSQQRASAAIPIRTPLSAFKLPVADSPTLQRMKSIPETDSIATLCEIAKREANLGHYQQATATLQEAIRRDPVNPDAYALWAEVASEQGNNEEAKRLWKKVVFLAPSRVDAWLDLGELYAASGDANRAKRMRQTALELLQGLRAEVVAYHGSPVPVPELTSYVAELLRTTEMR